MLMYLIILILVKFVNISKKFNFLNFIFLKMWDS